MRRRQPRWHWLLLALSMVLTLLALALIWVGQRGSNEVIATIYVDDQAYASYDLSAITETELVTIGEPGAQNTIRISPEGIAVIAADCPDQICVQQGTHSHGPTPIVCLPHHLSIRFSEKTDGSDGLDAVVG